MLRRLSRGQSPQNGRRSGAGNGGVRHRSATRAEADSNFAGAWSRRYARSKRLCCKGRPQVPSATTQRGLSLAGRDREGE